MHPTRADAATGLPGPLKRVPPNPRRPRGPSPTPDPAPMCRFCRPWRRRLPSHRTYFPDPAGPGPLPLDRTYLGPRPAPIAPGLVPDLRPPASVVGAPGPETAVHHVTPDILPGRPGNGRPSRCAGHTTDRRYRRPPRSTGHTSPAILGARPYRQTGHTSPVHLLLRRPYRQTGHTSAPPWCTSDHTVPPDIPAPGTCTYAHASISVTPDIAIFCPSRFMGHT